MNEKFAKACLIYYRGKVSDHILVLILLFLNACGGGPGGNSLINKNQLPQVNAGDDQLVESGQQVELVAMANDPDGYINTISWMQTAGDNIQLSSPDSIISSFYMPERPESSVFTFSIEVSDNLGSVASDSVSIIHQNSPPQISLINNHNAVPGSTVQLAVDATDSDGSIQSYRWEQISGEIVALRGQDTSEVSFVMPSLSSLTDIVIEVIVSDNKDLQSSESVRVAYANSSPTVEITSPEVVAPKGLVEIIGNFEDRDGTVENYSWQQTGGVTLDLSGRDSKILSFIAPDSVGEFSFRLEVVDNLGATTVEDFSLIVSEEIQISGEVTFDLVPIRQGGIGLDYNKIKIAPARSILVEALDEADTVVGATTTNDFGMYSLKIGTNKKVQIRVSSHMRNEHYWDVKVADNTKSGAVYAGYGDYFIADEEYLERNFHFNSGWSDGNYSEPRSAAPFAILDAVYDASRKFVEVDGTIELPALEIYWSEKNTTASGTLSEGDIGTTFYQSNKIYVLGAENGDTDEYDRHVIIHEWGHYFEDNLSRTDSIGGDHGNGDKLDFRVAFGEGWGNALAAIITDDSFYNDSSGIGQQDGFYIDIEDNQVPNGGWYNEASIQSLIYDLYDSDRDGVDNVSLGLAPLYSVLISESYRTMPLFTSVYSFIDELKSQQPAQSLEIDDLVRNQNIFGFGPLGEYETNDGGIPSVLPIYRSAKVNDVGTSGFCSVFDAGFFNKLGNTIFVTFEVFEVGLYKISVTQQGQKNFAVDVDFLIVGSGLPKTKAESPVLGSEELSINLNNGLYGLAIYAYDGRRDVCFDLKINKLSG